MTEIKIEKKRALWPLLLGIAVIGVLLYFMFFDNKKDVAPEVPTATFTAPVEEANNTVAAFVSFVNADTINMGIDHAYTREALLRLIDATNAVARDAGYTIHTDLDQAKAYADKIIQDPHETTHADNIGKAAALVSSTIQNIQQARFPSLNNEAVALKKAASAIDPNVLTLHQKEAIKTFFKQAADLLQKCIE